MYKYGGRDRLKCWMTNCEIKRGKEIIMKGWGGVGGSDWIKWRAKWQRTVSIEDIPLCRRNREHISPWIQILSVSRFLFYWLSQTVDWDFGEWFSQNNEGIQDPPRSSHAYSYRDHEGKEEPRHLVREHIGSHGAIPGDKTTMMNSSTAVRHDTVMMRWFDSRHMSRVSFRQRFIPSAIHSIRSSMSSHCGSHDVWNKDAKRDK